MRVITNLFDAELHNNYVCDGSRAYSNTLFFITRGKKMYVYANPSFM